MSSKPNDFKIGLFVLLGVAILLAALFIFGASKWFEGKTVEETYVEGDVNGLKVGAPVTLRGVPVGQVTRINFTWNVYHRPEPRYVYVEFEVDNQVSLAPPGKEYAQLVHEEVRKGLRARIKSQGLAAGTSQISLEYVDPSEYPPPPVPWTPRHVYVPSAPGEFSEILAGLNKTVANLKEIHFQKLEALLEQDLRAGQRVLDHAGEVDFRNLATNVDGLVADMRGMAARLRDFLGPDHGPEPAGLPQLSSRMDRLLAQTQAAVAALNQKFSRIDADTLDETLENLRRTSRELEETVEAVKQYPAGALFGRPPPPARSVERPRP